MPDHRPGRDGWPVGSVRIGEDAGRVALLVDGVVQSISPEDGLATGGYWAAMVPPERPRRALILGFGGGTIAQLIRARWGPDVYIVGVDDDVAIVETARAAGWFTGANLEVIYADAFAFVETSTDQFDYVAIDLFRGEQVVTRALTRQFLRRVRTLLVPPALVAVNIFSDRLMARRVARVGAELSIVSMLGVGGNLVIHARRRRR